MKTSIKFFSLLTLLLVCIPHVTYAETPQERKARERREMLVSAGTCISIAAVTIAILVGSKKLDNHLKRKSVQASIQRTHEDLNHVLEVLPSWESATDGDLQNLILITKPLRAAYSNLEKIEEFNAFDRSLISCIDQLGTDETKEAVDLTKKINNALERTRALKLKIAALPETKKQSDLLAQRELLPPAPVANTYVTQQTPVPVYYTAQPAYTYTYPGYTTTYIH